MIVYINSNNEIKDVHSTADGSLTRVELPEGVFEGWCEAKILCQKLDLKEGKYSGFGPAVDTRIIEHLDNLGKANERNASDIGDIALAIIEMLE